MRVNALAEQKANEVKSEERRVKNSMAAANHTVQSSKLKVQSKIIMFKSQSSKYKKTYDTWQEGLLQIFEAVLENKPFILNVYRSVSRERVENYLYALTYELIEGVVEEQSENLMVTEEQKKFIANFYKYSFVGVMLDWIKRGMKESPEEMAGLITVTMHGNVGNSLRNMEKNIKNGDMRICRLCRNVGNTRFWRAQRSSSES